MTASYRRIETASPRYSYLNLIDLVAPGTFNGTEVMTAHHYFPDVSSVILTSRKRLALTDMLSTVRDSSDLISNSAHLSAQYIHVTL